MRAYEITEQVWWSQAPQSGAIKVDRSTDWQRRYPGVKDSMGTYDKQSTIYADPRSPDYYNWIDSLGYIPPRDPQRQRGWYRDPMLSKNSWQWEPPTNQLNLHRADQRQGRQGVEDQPTRLNLTMVKSFVTAIGRAITADLIDPISHEEVAALLFSEGRSDFGFNAVDIERPQVKAVINRASKLGLTTDQSNFVGVIWEKQQTAKRLGIPFYQAWQGGKAHLQRYELNKQAAGDPRNQTVMNLIRQLIPIEAASQAANPPAEPDLDAKAPL